MANQISKLLNHIVLTFDANPLVNTIVFKDDDVVDVEKENVYPLVNIRVLNSRPDLNEKLVYFEFEILNQRDFIPKSQPSKLMLDTNYIDNLNICESIASDFIIEYEKSHNDLDIWIQEYSQFDFIRKDERNCLDGVKFDCTFLLHQNDI